MKTLISIALATVLLFSLSTTEVLAQDSDLLGVFFDEEGTQTTLNTTEQGQLVPFYIVLLEPSHAEGIDYWECTLGHGPVFYPPVIFGWEYMGDGHNNDAPPHFRVGLSTPLPPAGAVALATALVYVTDPEAEVLFYLRSHDLPSLEDPPGSGYPVRTPLYRYGDNQFQSLDWTSGCEAEPVARINDDGVDPAWSLGELPDEIDFGEIPAGAWSQSFAVELENTGEVAVSGRLDTSGAGFEYRQSGEFWIDAPTWFRIEPGEDKTVYLRVQSAVNEEYTGAFDVTVCGETTSITLVKTGVYSSCIVDPTFVDFGEVDLNDPEPATSLVTITNDGMGNLTLSVAEDCPDFAGELSIPPETLLLPGQSCELWVTFDPSVLGPQTCVISLGDDACEDVVCTAVAVDVPASCIVDPPSVDFGEVDLYDPEPATSTVTITNDGPGYLWLSANEDCPDFAVELSLPPETPVFPGESCELWVTFDPSVLGPQTCVISLGDDACADVECTVVVIDGPPQCVITPETWDFGDVWMGDEAQQDFEIRNDGGQLLEGQVTLPASSGFSVVDGAGPFNLGHGETHQFTVAFKPLMAGVHEWDLVVSPDCGSIGLVGVGIPISESFSVEPESIDFSIVCLGDGRQREITIDNEGDVSLTGELQLDGLGESSPEGFTLEDAGPFTVSPGEEAVFEIGFAPPYASRFSAIVTTGLPGWSMVRLKGWGVIAAPDCWHYESGDAAIMGSAGGFANVVAVVGDHAYTGGLCVIDIGDPCAPQVMGCVGGGNGVAATRDYAYVTHSYTQPGGFNVPPRTWWYLSVIDVSDPTDPLRLTNENYYFYGGWFGPHYGSQDVVVLGNHAFVVGPGLHIFDITDPLAPEQVNDATGGLWCGDGLAVSGDYAYVLSNSPGGGPVPPWYGLIVFDITDLQHPATVGSVELPERGLDVTVAGAFAYVAAGDLHIFDISVPKAPNMVGFAETPGDARGVDVVGNHAYVAAGEVGVHVIDVANPSSPMILGTMDTPGVAYDLAHDDQYLYLADGSAMHVALLQCETSVATDGNPEKSGADEGVPFLELRLSVFPNPFNPQATVALSLPRSTWTEIGVYDLTGRRVTVLASRTFTTGPHTLTWNGRDSQGRAMPSGTYIVRLETESGVEARKVMLVR